MRLVVFCCSLSLLALTSCDTGGGNGGSATTAAASAATNQPETTTVTVTVTDSSPDNSSGTGFSVAELMLTFTLVDSFVQEADGDYAFSAASMSPRSFFTIYTERPSITDHSPRPGEVLRNIDLGPGITAVIVLDAAIEGLPAGVSANELLVSNGEQSFSVIMSSVSAHLDEFWTVFIASVKVATPG